MASVNEIVSGALKLLGVKDAESTLTPTEVQDGLVSLNDMMAEWEEDSIHTGFVPLAQVSDDVIVPAFANGAIKAKLAIYIAPEYDKPVSRELEQRAKSSFTSLRAALVRLRASEFPDSLPTGSGNDIYNVSTGDIPGDNSGTFYPENEKRNF